MSSPKQTPKRGLTVRTNTAPAGRAYIPSTGHHGASGEIPFGAHAHRLGWHFDDLSDFRFCLVIKGRPFSFKRAHQVVTFGGHSSIGLTKEAKHYLRDAASQLRAQWLPLFRTSIPAGIELNAAIRSYLPTRQLPDASNLYEGVQDALKCCTHWCKPKCNRHAGIIADDVQIRTHNGSDRLYSPHNPRVEITLTLYRGEPTDVYLPGMAIEEKTR